LKPTILIDGLAFENRNQVGIWRVFYEVLTRLKERVSFIILVGKPPSNPVPSGIPIRHSSHRATGRRSLDPFFRIKRKRAAINLANEFPNAIWHSTYFSCDPRPKHKSIVHVYDMVAEHFYHFSDTLADQCVQKAQAIRQADVAISISRSTTAELERFFPEIRDRTFTASLGVDHIKVDSPLASSRVRNSIFVGHRDSYKNFVIILRAMTNPIWPCDHKLTVIGPPFSQHELAHIEYFGLNSRIEHLGRLSDSELSKAYANASSLIFPSLEEGFGFPTLEAQIHGCIPLLSHIPVFHEVSGGQAIFFNPYDPESLALAIKSLDDIGCIGMRERCVDNASRFTWIECAESIFQIYLKLM